MLTILASGSASSWASLYKLTHPVLEDTSRSLSAPYGNLGFPTHVIIDRTMTVRFIQCEDYDDARYVALIKQYL